jgi:hypothetical protein
MTACMIEFYASRYTIDLFVRSGDARWNLIADASSRNSELKDIADRI